MTNKIPFKYSYKENVKMLDDYFRVNENFDLVARDIKLASHNAKMYFIDGFAKDALLEKIMAFIMKLTDEEIDACKDTLDFANKLIP